MLDFVFGFGAYVRSKLNAYVFASYIERGIAQMQKKEEEEKKRNETKDI